jgi:DNA topoisomerase-1
MHGEDRNMKNMKLVIFESPTKAKTISRFLGKGFLVDSSYGHIRDLPKTALGIDVENNFEPKYIIPIRARKTVTNLKKEVEKADTVILATDEDREGEAIAWHLVRALNLDGAEEEKKKTKKASAKPAKKEIQRIVFHEITEKAIGEALLHPRDIDVELVNAQQARRILDRLVGYKLSPFLWKKVARGLSAGRVQSIALRFIVEREREILAFIKEEYWTIDAVLKKKGADLPIEAHLTKIKGEAIPKLGIQSGEEAKKIAADLETASFAVSNVEKRAVTRHASAPFTTSTLQQEASRKLGFSAKQTMMLAQQLYEGIETGEGQVGLITYMRTDSLNLSEEALRTGKETLTALYGEKYTLPEPRKFKTKSKGAQEAHEAIRPTEPRRTPDELKPFLERNQHRLYDLIWRRFMASQMPDALFDATSIDIAGTAKNKTEYALRASGQVMKFDGFLKVYISKTEETPLPDVAIGENLENISITPTQHFTEPPPRYSEASLIKLLEEHGIGRPSTYAPTMATIQERRYVIRDDKKRLQPTEMGLLVNDILVEHFPEIVDAGFTAAMEERLDDVAEGKREWQPVLKEFFDPFIKNLEIKMEEVQKTHTDEKTDEVCEKCGKPMIVKFGRFGKFLACSGFPECKNAKPWRKEPDGTEMKCPKCIEGIVITRRTKRGKIFWGCSRYPACDFASWTNPALKKEEEPTTETPAEDKKDEEKEEISTSIEE